MVNSTENCDLCIVLAMFGMCGRPTLNWSLTFFLVMGLMVAGFTHNLALDEELDRFNTTSSPAGSRCFSMLFTFIPASITSGLSRNVESGTSTSLSISCANLKFISCTAKGLDFNVCRTLCVEICAISRNLKFLSSTSPVLSLVTCMWPLGRLAGSGVNIWLGSYIGVSNSGNGFSIIAESALIQHIFLLGNIVY